MEKSVKKQKEMEVKTTGGKIDRDVLDVMKQKDILDAIKNQKQANRLILNCFCEFLSEVKALHQSVDDLVQLLSVCSSDKLAAFFKELNSNVADEKKKIAVRQKIEQGHRKPKKSVK